MEVEIRDTGFHVGGKAVDFISGEFHYWRVKRENWPKILQRLRGMGVRVVSTYVPWNFHAVDGGFDFEGKTDGQRDLNGFIDLVKREGFLMMLRPGPYIYAEWSYAGATAEAFKHHRFSVEFRRLASEYIDTVCRVSVVPNLVTRGGPIFVVQVDNEIDPWVNFHRKQLALSRGSGPFKEFLAAKYPTVADLNRAWKSNYASIDEVEAFEDLPERTSDNFSRGLIRRYLDYRSFLDWAVEQTYTWIAESYRRNGVDVPLVVNTYDDPVFHDLTKLRRIADLPCMDIYLTRHMPPQEFLKLSYWVKAYSAYTKFAVATEFQSGTWTDALYNTGPIDGRHQRLIALAAMAWGLKGWNWYMAVGRDNWVCAPINEWGLINPDLYSSMEGVSRLYDKVRPSSLRRITVLALVHYRPQLLLKDPGELFSGEIGWGACFRSLHEVGVDFTFFNPQVGEERRNLVLYAGNELMEPEDAENLLEVAKKGSHLVFFRKCPATDFDGHSLAVSEDLPVPAGSVSEPRGKPSLVSLSRGDKRMELTLRGFDFYGESSGDRILLRGVPRRNAYVDEEPSLEEHVVGVSRGVGDGRITILGLDPTTRVVEFLLEAFDVKVPARATTPSTCVSMHEDAGSTSRRVLFVINNSTQRQVASVMVHLPDGSYRYRSLTSEDEGSLDGGSAQINVSVDWKDAAVVEIENVR